MVSSESIRVEVGMLYEEDLSSKKETSRVGALLLEKIGTSGQLQGRRHSKSVLF